MNRRDFIARLLGGAAGAALAATVDLEQLLWVPKPIITVPAMPTRLAFHPDAFKLALGDLFTLDGRFAVNPVTGETTKHPQYFVVTSVTESGGEFWPPIVTEGRYRTVGGHGGSMQARPILIGEPRGVRVVA